MGRPWGFRRRRLPRASCGSSRCRGRPLLRTCVRWRRTAIETLSNGCSVRTRCTSRFFPPVSSFWTYSTPAHTGRRVGAVELCPTAPDLLLDRHLLGPLDFRPESLELRLDGLLSLIH